MRAPESLNLIVSFRGGEGRIDRCRRGPESPSREDREDEFDPVRQHDGDYVAAADSSL